MDNFRKAMIEELMLTLKIPQGNFNFGTIANELNNISNNNLKNFYKEAMTADSFGNGMKAIFIASSKFKRTEEEIMWSNVLKKKGFSENDIQKQLQDNQV